MALRRKFIYVCRFLARQDLVQGEWISRVVADGSKMFVLPGRFDAAETVSELTNEKPEDGVLRVLSLRQAPFHGFPQLSRRHREGPRTTPGSQLASWFYGW